VPGSTKSPPRAASVKRAYDVCVLGTQLGGVAAGALLARRGFRVLHVDADGRGTGYEEGGWRLPWGPALVPAPRVFPAAELVLAELGLASDAGRRLEPSRSPLQILLPRHRLDLPISRSERASELRREWPVDASRLEGSLEAVRALFDREQPFLASHPPLPARGLRARWRLHRAQRLVPGGAGRGAMPLADLGDHPLASALRATGPFLSSLDGEPSPLGLSRTLGAVLQGTLRTAGGEGAVAALLRRRIAESRGEFLGGEGDPAPVSALELDGGRLIALLVNGTDSRYSARAFVFAGDPGTLPALVGNSRRLESFLAGAVPSGWIFSMSWVVRADALPGPLGDVAIALPSDGPPVLVQTVPAPRAGAKGHEASPGEKVLTAGMAIAQGASPAEAATRLRRAVAEFLPFLDRATLHESATGERGAAVGFHPLFAARPDRALGVGGVSSASPISNLFLAGREVLPGLGFEGHFQAAWQAAQAVEMLLGSKPRPK
jgi:phytoene dehydrogenase-like protein